MRSVATRRFWELYRRLPAAVRRLADKTYRLWRKNPEHPSLGFKRLKGGEERFSIRVGLYYRAPGRKSDDVVEWVWIGTHADYDQVIRRG